MRALDWEKTTASIVAPFPETSLLEDVIVNRRPISQNAHNTDELSVSEVTAATNMVLFVSTISQPFKGSC